MNTVKWSKTELDKKKLIEKLKLKTNEFIKKY